MKALDGPSHLTAAYTPAPPPSRPRSPQMLIGLIGAEVSHPLGVASGNGLLGWIAYIGAAVAGEPLAMLVKQHGWPQFFTALSAH